MSQAEVTPVNVHILDKEFRIACSEEEREDLLAAARYLDEKMREIRRSGKVIGADRIAVMAALNIAHELLQDRREKEEKSAAIAQHIQNLQKKIAVAIDSGNQLEL
ncbi:MAG TPA: cell division protein ZapA [Chromatiales bacterium]|nr:cell division protein ZapA [Chromatiales bacterium]